MWATARYDFGLTDEEFWGLTTPEFAALYERHMETVRTAAATQALATFVLRYIGVAEANFLPPEIDIDDNAVDEFSTAMKIDDMKEWTDSLKLVPRAK